MNRLTTHHTNRFALYEASLLGFNRCTTVERTTEGVDDATEKLRTNWYAKDFALKSHLGASANFSVATK
ncbi:hypothetical protein D3C87_1998080 [compost metagenome]